MRYEYQIVPLTEMDKAGFRARRGGFEVRDLMLVLAPGKKRRAVLLTRSGTGGTVAEAFVRTGEGVLDIDASRVGATEENKAAVAPKNRGPHEMGRENAVSQMNSAVRERADIRLGRFPSNVILEHDKECRKEGLRSVGRGETYTYGGRTYEVEGFMPSCKPKAPSNRGREKVESWQCTSTCLVRALDAQSGLLRSGYMAAGVPYTNNSQTYGQPSGSTQTDTYGDEGGASRFFRQVKGVGSLEAYLDKLVRRS